MTADRIAARLERAARLATSADPARIVAYVAAIVDRYERDLPGWQGDVEGASYETPHAGRAVAAGIAGRTDDAVAAIVAAVDAGETDILPN